VSTASLSLTRQLLQWLDERPRTREEALDAWRTSCPRLSIWEDAWTDCLIETHVGGRWLIVSAKGRKFLEGEI
jgi:hypothetical protein